MSTRYLPKKSRKAISPVIATVILVAVAVVIAAAMAGFAGSLFGSYSNGPQIKIQSMSIVNASGAASDLTGTISLSNSGNAADTVTKVVINNIGSTATDGNLGATTTIDANSNPVDVTFTITPPANGADVGQQVTAVVYLQSGATVTQSVSVTSS